MVNPLSWERFVFGHAVGDKTKLVVDKEALSRFIQELRIRTWDAAIHHSIQTMRNAINERRTVRYVFVGKPRELWAADLMAVTLEKELGRIDRSGIEVSAASVPTAEYSPDPRHADRASIRGNGGPVANDPT